MCRRCSPSRPSRSHRRSRPPVPCAASGKPDRWSWCSCVPTTTSILPPVTFLRSCTVSRIRSEPLTATGARRSRSAPAGLPLAAAGKLTRKQSPTPRRYMRTVARRLTAVGAAGAIVAVVAAGAVAAVVCGLRFLCRLCRSTWLGCGRLCLGLRLGFGLGFRLCLCHCRLPVKARDASSRTARRRPWYRRNSRRYGRRLRPVRHGSRPPRWSGCCCRRACG